jgi:hypothetical protein
MGYYSNVRVNTTNEGYERFMELVPESELYFLKPGHCGFRLTKYDGTVMFGWQDVKWYDGYSDVNAMMRAIRTIAAEGFPVEYIRIGEAFDDIENIAHNTDGLKHHIEIARSIYLY